MLIPRFWARAEGAATDAAGRRLALRLWGWSQESAADALELAKRRVAGVSARLSRAAAAAGTAYLYGDRAPLREEIVRYLGDPGTPGHAVITRNGYGSLVLNTEHVPFIDVDAAAPSGLGGLRRLFGRAPAIDPALERIRGACARCPQYAFRVYRTHSGYRLLVANAALDPTSEETRAFLNDFGADPAFVALCRVQRSFRARLTPKPWRCGSRTPPGRHPRDADAQQRFASWLQTYDAASRGHATCRFIEAAGAAGPGSASRVIVEEHDRTTRAMEALPLA